MELSRRFPAKILLFGEYTVLFGGSALAVPYHRYEGFWAPMSATRPQRDWEPLLQYFDTIQSQLHAPLLLDKLNEFVHHEAYFQSTIPMGQGLGSSAALVASMYAMFAQSGDVASEQLHDLALMESYFHGRSSGIDALVSFRDQPVLSDQHATSVVEIPDHPRHQAYLWHTGTVRSTEPLVRWFADACGNDDFKREMTRLAAVSQQALSAFRSGDTYLELVQSIGRMQWQYLRPLIPEDEYVYWEEILSDDSMAVKLCGAGGGGCVLIFAEGVNVASRFPELKIELIW